MPQEKLPSGEAQPEIRPDYFELEEQKEKLFEKLKKITWNLSIAERDHLVFRVMEHSVDDGLALAEFLCIERDAIIEGLVRPEFIKKHPDFSLKLNNKAQEYRPFVPSNTFEEADLLSLTIFISAHQVQRDLGIATAKWSDKIRLTQPAAGLLKEIDSYYENFIRLRQVKEQKSPLSGLSLGEQLGQQNIELARMALEPHYYTGPLRQILHKLITDPEQQKRLDLNLDRTNFISETILVEIADAFELDRNSLAIPPLPDELEKARYRPLGPVYQEGNKAAQKELRAELETSLQSRGYTPRDFAVRFDEAAKRYEVVDKTGKVSRFENSHLRLTGELLPYEMPPEDPYYEAMKKGVNPDEIDPKTHNLKLFRHWEILGDQLCEKISNRRHREFIIWPGGRRSRMHFVIGRPTMVGKKLVMLSRIDSEGLNPGDEPWQVMVDGESINPDPTWGANEFVNQGDDIYWVGFKNLNEAAGYYSHHTIRQSAIFKNKQLLFSEEIGRAIKDLRVEGGIISYIYREKTREQVEEDTLVIGDKKFGPFKTITLTDKPDHFYGEKMDGSQFFYSGDKEFPVDKNWKMVSVENIGNTIYAVATSQEDKQQYIIDQHSNRLSNGYKEISHLSLQAGQLTYLAEDSNGQLALHFGAEVFDLKSKKRNVAFYPDDTFFTFSLGKLFYIDQYLDQTGNVAYDLLSSTGEKMTFKPGEEVQRLVSINDRLLVLTSPKEKPAYRVYEYSSKLSLTDQELRKLELLNVLADEKLETINNYLKRYYPVEEAKSLTEKVKGHLQGSKRVAKTITGLIKESPSLFLDSLKAKADEFSDKYIENLLFGLFPDLKAAVEHKRGQRSRWERSSFGGGSGLGIFDGDRVTSEFRDGDPIEAETTELLRLRQPLDEILSTGIYGRSDEKGRTWEQAPLPILTKHFGPTKEITAEVLEIKGKKQIILPKCVNGVIIPERVLGIKADGKEVILTPEFNVMGEARVKLPKGVERVVYSQTVQELPVVPELVDDKEYAKAKERWERSFGKEVGAPIARLPSELKAFLNSIAELAPVEKLEAIEDFVRAVSYYDFNNREMQKEKQGKGADEVIKIMAERLKELEKKAKPEEKGQLTGKKFAGVCADFAKLTTALLREAGFAGGMIQGLLAGPGETVLTNHSAHGVSFALWPAEDNKVKVIVLDGTPSGATAEAESILASMRQPSLRERLEKFKEQASKINDNAEKDLAELEALINLDAEGIKRLENGQLERVLNVVLRQVKESHLAVVKRALNASRYAGFDVVAMAHGDRAQEAAFQRFLSNEIDNERRSGKEEAHFKGEDLLATIEDFARRYTKDGHAGGTLAALDIIQRVFDLSGNDLDPVESRAAAAVVTYLRARGMAGK